MSILFTRPATLDLSSSRLPDGYCEIAKEESLSDRVAQHRFGALAQVLARISLAVWVSRSVRKNDAIVTGRYGEGLALARGVCGIGCPPMVLLDVEWTCPRAALSRALRIALHRMVARGVAKIGVFCEAEAGRYSRFYGIPPRKFAWVPFCCDAVTDGFSGSGGNYIFAGGNHDRDWPTLFAAVASLPVEVRIATDRANLSRASIPENVIVLPPLSRSEWARQVRDARIVVVAVSDYGMRFPGVRAYVEAMRLGKCVIVNDPEGAGSYIRDGDTGILVKQRDASDLRRRSSAPWRTMSIEPQLDIEQASTREPISHWKATSTA